MSKTPNDGGAAYPSPPEAGFEHGEHGMSLRDYFAGQVLAGIFNHGGADDCGPKDIAHDCYLYADEMIEARGA